MSLALFVELSQAKAVKKKNEKKEKKRKTATFLCPTCRWISFSYLFKRQEVMKYASESWTKLKILNMCFDEGTWKKERRIEDKVTGIYFSNVCVCLQVNWVQKLT